MTARSCFGPKTAVVNFEQLSTPRLPEQTKSYTPLGHQDFVKMVLEHLEAEGVKVISERHGLWRDGQRYFGILEVSHPTISSPEMNLSIALRNSFDKSVPASIAAGNAVFVCDNLQIAGEIVIGRKHTRNMFDDIRDRIASALAVLESYWLDHFERVEVYKQFELGDKQANDLIVEAYRKGAIGKTGVADVIDQWYNPNHAEFKDRNVWSLENAFTEIFKGRADLLTSRTEALHCVLDKTVGFSTVRVYEALKNINPKYIGASGRGARSMGV